VAGQQYDLRPFGRAIEERRVEKADYDAGLARAVVERARTSFDKILAQAAPSKRNRELIEAYWERGAQPDLRPALEKKIAEIVASHDEGRENLLQMLKVFLPDPNYRTADGMALYGAAALLLRIAEQAAIDHMQLISDAMQALISEQEAGA